MRFSIDWVADAQNAVAEERATLCDLRVLVGGKNVSAFYDPNEKVGYDGIVVPAVLFAEGIATDWWKIFGARDVEHRVLAWRQGFVLPDVYFEFDGSMLAVTCKPFETTNPQRLFWQSAQEYLTRDQAESALSEFVEQVVDRLHASGARNSDVELAWNKVRASQDDEEERNFCEAAGALGVDPYIVDDADASFIEQTGALFEGEALIEFLAGIRQTSDLRTELIEWIEGLRPRECSRLPELAAVADEVGRGRNINADRPWDWGHRAAREFREKVGVDTETTISVETVAEKLGGARFSHLDSPGGLYAVVAREGDDDIQVHLRNRGPVPWASSAETFAFARAIGDVVCFPGTRRSVINSLHRAERQAVGRAFAAEFVAPVKTVLAMKADGRDIDEIAGALGVNAKVVEHQIENSEAMRA